MNTLWRKAIRDLLGERIRSVSIVFSLALGVAGFFAVLSSYPIIMRALNTGYRATNPASAILTVDRLDDAMIRSVTSTRGIQDAEAQRTVHGRIKTGPGQWQNLILFVRNDFETTRIAHVALKKGSWPSRKNDIAIERDAFQVAKTQVGNTVVVRTAKGTEHSLQVCGSIHDVGQAQARMENIVYGYITLETLAALGDEPYLNELLIRVAQRPLDATYIQEIVNTTAEMLRNSGHRVIKSDIPEPGQHPHAKLMGMLLMSIAVFGFFILALSGVIIFNVLVSLLAGQMRQIGVMKAIGGTRVQIGSVFLLEAGLLGLAAIVIALPIGLMSSRWISQWIATFLNFDIMSYAVPFWVYLLVFVVGIAVPLFSALLPVWLGTRVPVHEALTSNNATRSTYGTSMVDRALARVSGLSRVLLLVIRNTGRNRLRVTLTLITLAAGGIFFMSALNLRQSMIRTIDDYYTTLRYDLAVNLTSDSHMNAVKRASSRFSGASVTEGWVITKGETQQRAEENITRANNKKYNFAVFGMPEGSKLMSFHISAGKNPHGVEKFFLVNTALYDKLGKPAIDSKIAIKVKDTKMFLRITGVVKEAFSQPAAYLSLSCFNDKPKDGMVNSLRIKFSNLTQASLDAAKLDVEKNLHMEGMSVASVNTKSDSRHSFDEHMVMIYVFLIVVSCILGAVGALGLLTTVSMNVTERRREIGVLRAIGGTPGRIIEIIVLEGLAVGIMAWLLSTVAVIPLGKNIGDAMLRSLLRSEVGIDLSFDLIGVVVWLAIIIVGSIGASLWPARQASRMSVREALTYE